MQIPRRKADELKPRDNSPVYLTEEGFGHMQKKLARLKSALPNLTAEAQRTAAYGDRSDSAEYKEAKSNLRRTRWSILSIQDQMKRVVIITSSPNTSGAVQIGSTVVLEASGVRKTFQILGSHETDPVMGRISFKSPLGAALMNHAEGDIVTIQTLSGSKKYRILKIR